MDYFFLVSYHGSSYDKLEKSLNAHNQIQKIERNPKEKKIYFNLLDVEESKTKHKNLFAGSLYFDTVLENYEIASVDVLKNHFFIYYFDKQNILTDNEYLGYRLRRMYEMIMKSNDFIIFYNENNNFTNLLTYLENKFELSEKLIEPKEYKQKVIGYEKSEKCKVYEKIITEQFQSKILV